MEKYDGKRTVKQQDDLPCEQASLLWRTALFENRAKPVLNSLLVGAAHNDRGMTGQVNEFYRCAQEAAALPVGTPCRCGEVAEDAPDFLPRPAFDICEPALEQRQIRLVACLQIGRDQIILAAEMIVERSLGQPGFRGYGIDADRADSLSMEQFSSRLDNAFTRGSFQLAHVCVYTE